ncbi:MAG: amylo-alpha-1,6-glucosidase [Candidatus Hadarchaeales archaeon]
MNLTIDHVAGLENYLGKEWVISNGLGGYASSTVLGINTRRYHGLLVVPFAAPPFSRKVVLEKFEEKLEGEEVFNLSSNEYPGVIHPDGWRNLLRYRQDPLPTFHYISGTGISVVKSIFMPYGLNTVVVEYSIENPTKRKLSFRVFPLVNFRDIHSLSRLGSVEFSEDPGKTHTTLSLKGSSQPFITIWSEEMLYFPSGLREEQKWYKNFIYREERERGYDFVGDAYCPGSFEAEITSKTTKIFIAAAGGSGSPPKRLTSRELERLREETKARLWSLVERSGLGVGWRHLCWAADSFIAGNKIIAGYHWFGCWGRDTAISLPGLTLVTERFEDARKILLYLAGRINGWLIPTWFEGDSAGYESLDPSLWFIYAVHRYLAYTDDIEMAGRMWPICSGIVKAISSGKIKGVRVERDGLLSSTLTTWMDARIGGRPVTPRAGKAVEINALWYNALKSLAGIGRRIGRSFPLGNFSKLVEENFLRVFWNEKKGCLFDVVGEGKDDSIRPNQIFAISLPFPVVDTNTGKRIVEVVRRDLLTDFGLRSLSRESPFYLGRCQGNITERDLAYHQGTVWSWLMGPFITAFMRTGGSREEAMNFLRPLITTHLEDAGIGTISEIFDGDCPHLPRGCISQAWSVGEILRCYAEDIKGLKPEYENLYR